MECKKCGHIRTAADSAPEGQCPACGAYYAKVERHARATSRLSDRDAERGSARVESAVQETWVARAFSVVLIGLSWLILLVFIVALVDENLVLALITLPALAVVIPSVGRRIPLKARGGLVGAVVVGIVASGLYANHQKGQEMERAAQERQERREQVAAERAEQRARFTAERAAIIEAARRDLDGGRYAAVLAVAHAWRQVDDPALREFATMAHQQAKSAIEAGNLRVLEGYRASDFPQFENLSAQVEKRRVAMDRAAKDVACKRDLECWAKRHQPDAETRCPSHIEGLARFAHEWTEGFWGLKFSRFQWKDRADGSITYVGDAIRFQNGFGAWQPHVYECDFHPEKASVLSVRVRPGRL